MERKDLLKPAMILEVPFKEKEEAKRLGAWWDPILKKWYVPVGKDIAPFRKWFPLGDKPSEHSVEFGD